MKKKHILFTVLLLLFSFIFYFFTAGQRMLEEFAAQTLKEVALGKNGKGYFVNFQEFSIEWGNSRIEATGISIIPHINQEKNSWVNGTVDTLIIEFSNLYLGALSKNITIEDLRIIHPNFQYFWNENTQNKNKKVHNPIPKFDALRARLSKIGIHTISILNTEFNGYLVTNNYNHLHIFHTSQNFILEGLKFNLDSLDNKNKVVDLEKFHFSSGPTFMKGHKDLYQYQFDTLLISNTGDFFKLGGLKLSPQYSDDTFFKMIGKQTDRFIVEIESLEGHGLAEKELFNQDRFHLDKIIINSLNANIYRDKNFEEDSSVIKQLPHISLKALDFQLAIDSIELKNSQLTYQEKSKDATHAGHLPITHINGVISDVNNKNENIIQLELACELLDKADTKLSIDVFLGRKEPYFMTAEGHIDAFPLSALNQFTHDNMGVQFQRGIATAIDFNAQLNDSIGRGNLDFFYQDLKIKITGKNDSKSSVIESIAGFAANNLVHRNNFKNRKPRHAPLYYKRIQYKSFIHYLIHTVMSGAQTAVIGTYSQLPDDEKKAYKKHKRDAKKKHH
ncbi:hypothetical protein [Flammeovirga aprica]|uniref:DUF748 domain-containing protein n=1 Tax=Flammeovirga aprica JL-4 TaxID=694437 RepID=A0A7X9P3C0_9BACT|nr:hypothetical protein [Flammeovirga aprica]NME68428.1 hypothetical protein [Flammeovirga aprica JL-4]